jgi:hypothetical protein
MDRGVTVGCHVHDAGIVRFSRVSGKAAFIQG